MPNETTIALDDVADRFAAEQAMAAIVEAETALDRVRNKAARIIDAIVKRKCPNAPAGPFRMVANRAGNGLDAIVFTTPAADEPAKSAVPEATGGNGA